MDLDRTVYVGGLPPDVTEAILYELFLQTGPIERVTVKGNIAFVTFEDEESVLYSCCLFSGLRLFGKEVVIQPKSGSKFAKTKILPVPPFTSSRQNITSLRESQVFSPRQMTSVVTGLRSPVLPFTSSEFVERGRSFATPPLDHIRRLDSYRPSTSPITSHWNQIFHCSPITPPPHLGSTAFAYRDAFAHGSPYQHGFHHNNNNRDRSPFSSSVGSSYNGSTYSPNPARRSSRNSKGHSRY